MLRGVTWGVRSLVLVSLCHLWYKYRRQTSQKRRDLSGPWAWRFQFTISEYIRLEAMEPGLWEAAGHGRSGVQKAAPLLVEREGGAGRE